MKNFFHDISWAQIAAGALAAMTSFWLAAKIGVAGSIIGVAIGSIVSAVASQIYKNVLEASGQKFQETVIGGDDDKNAVDTTDDTSNRETQTMPQVGRETTVMRPVGGKTGGGQASGEETTLLPPARHDSGRTTVMQPVSADNGGRQNCGRTVVSTNGGGNHRGDDALGGSHQGGRAIALSPAQIKRRKRNIIIVSVVSALVAVILSALAINLLTKGEGTDHVVRNVVSPSTTEQTTEGNPTETTRPQDERGETSQPSVTTQPSQGHTQTPQQTTRPTQQEPEPSPDASNSKTPTAPETTPTTGSSPDSASPAPPSKAAQ